MVSNLFVRYLQSTCSFIATFRSLFEVPGGIDCQHHLFHKIAWSNFFCINMSSKPLNPVQVLLISYRNMNPYRWVWWPAMDMLQRWNFHPRSQKKYLEVNDLRWPPPPFWGAKPTETNSAALPLFGTARRFLAIALLAPSRGSISGSWFFLDGAK